MSTTPALSSPMSSSRAHILVVGNAKGGSGKSTTAMHVAVRLLCLGQRVAVVDLDDRQQTLARYMENRALFAARKRLDLPMPEFAVVPGSTAAQDATAANRAGYEALCEVLEDMASRHDTVVLDCPGADTYLSRVAHGFADTLVTPINDSFIDIDLLARIDPETHSVMQPSWYSEMVWEQRKRRFLADGASIDWVVLRNRAPHTEARNKRNVGKVLANLSGRVGFRLGPGLGDRVIFRELFLKGLTLSDVRTYRTGVELTMNHVVAHQEIKDVVSFLRVAKNSRAA